MPSGPAQEDPTPGHVGIDYFTLLKFHNCVPPVLGKPCSGMPPAWGCLCRLRPDMDPLPRKVARWKIRGGGIAKSAGAAVWKVRRGGIAKVRGGGKSLGDVCF